MDIPTLGRNKTTKSFLLLCQNTISGNLEGRFTINPGNINCTINFNLLAVENFIQITSVNEFIFMFGLYPG